MARFVLFSLPVADAPRDGHARQVLNGALFKRHAMPLGKSFVSNFSELVAGWRSGR
jgi:hypothetical protein